MAPSRRAPPRGAGAEAPANRLGFPPAAPGPGPQAPPRVRIVDTGPLACIVGAMTFAALLRELQANGWALDRVCGSHRVLKPPDRAGFLVVPHPAKDLGAGLVAAIRKRAGL